MMQLIRMMPLLLIRSIVILMNVNTLTDDDDYDGDLIDHNDNYNDRYYGIDDNDIAIIDYGSDKDHDTW